MERPLYFTFGNHMHWVDMQWLWGYDVLPGCVDDMQALIEGAGVRGNVNFDAVGYEKMAAECPDALARLRRAVQSGEVGVVGGSYGQPYGLFHDGESNIRQFTFGVRAVQRHLGVRPRTFWEEEFWFLPQLPQILDGCGYTGACLFFQWTWHTPEVPVENVSLIDWEGHDGTSLPTLPRNALNVHQWPEDFDGLLESDLVAGSEALSNPAIVQWVELMPSRDWMCRSEVLLPRLRELLADPRFELRPRTADRLITELDAATPERPRRRYSMDDVWHGMTLGKNGDRHPRRARQIAGGLVGVESFLALASLFGRPYASWDVYPTWELDEAWRELLAAQHHDIHECEGLCGAIGHIGLDRARGLLNELGVRVMRLFIDRAPLTDEDVLKVNACGWEREIDGTVVPAFGYAVAREQGRRPPVARESDRWRQVTAGGEFQVGRDGTLQWLVGGEVRGRLTFSFDGTPLVCHEIEEYADDDDDPSPVVGVGLATPTGEVSILVMVEPTPCGRGVDLEITGSFPRPAPGLNAGLKAHLRGDWVDLVADTPYAVGSVAPTRTWRRKYPSGDWMTSEQWFEDVERPFVASSFVDLIHEPGGAGTQVVHDGSQQWFRTDDGVDVMLCAYDPWDEARHHANEIEARLVVRPHDAPLRNAERVRFASEVSGGTASQVVHPFDRTPTLPAIPSCLGGPVVSGLDGVIATSWHRESARSGEGLDGWAGHAFAEESEGASTHPFVLRLVEFDGVGGEVTVTFPGEVAAAAKTNLMGEVGPKGTMRLSVGEGSAPRWADRSAVDHWSQVRFEVRPHEIVTVMCDLIPGRKQWRDLDARRKVWAQVHKEPPS